MTAFALYTTGKGSPSFKVYTSANAMKNIGNGFIVVTSADDIKASALTISQMTACYNAFAKTELKDFKSKTIAADRLFAEMQKLAENMEVLGKEEPATEKGEDVPAKQKKLNRAPAKKERKPRAKKADGEARVGRNENVIIRASDEVLKMGNADQLHRPGSDAHVALTKIIGHGKKGAPWRDLINSGINTKYISRTLRLTDYLVSSEK